MTGSRAGRKALRYLVGALLLVVAATAVTAANTSLLFYADGHPARPGMLRPPGETRPAARQAPPADLQLRAREYQRNASIPRPGAASPVSGPADRPRPGVRRRTAEKPASAELEARRTSDEPSSGGVDPAPEPGNDAEPGEPTAEPGQDRAEHGTARERSHPEKALEREARDVEKGPAEADPEKQNGKPDKGDKAKDRPAKPPKPTPPGEHDDD